MLIDSFVHSNFLKSDFRFVNSLIGAVNLTHNVKHNVLVLSH